MSWKRFHKLQRDREEKYLCYIAMVAKFLDDNKQKKVT